MNNSGETTEILVFFSAVLTDWWERLSAAIRMELYHLKSRLKTAPTSLKHNRVQDYNVSISIRRAALSPEAIARVKLHRRTMLITQKIPNLSCRSRIKSGMTDPASRIL
jgi:hypothetical protein